MRFYLITVFALCLACFGCTTAPETSDEPIPYDRLNFGEFLGQGEKPLVFQDSETGPGERPQFNADGTVAREKPILNILIKQILIVDPETKRVKCALALVSCDRPLLDVEVAGLILNYLALEPASDIDLEEFRNEPKLFPIISPQLVTKLEDGRSLVSVNILDERGVKFGLAQHSSPEPLSARTHFLGRYPDAYVAQLEQKLAEEQSTSSEK